MSYEDLKEKYINELGMSIESEDENELHLRQVIALVALKFAHNYYKKTRPPETAPKDGTVFLGRFKNYPGWVSTVYNDCENPQWVISTLQISQFLGRPDPYFESDYLNMDKLIGWLPMPEVSDDTQP